MASINKKLSRIFKEMSAIYQLTGPENRFRALAYLRAARIIGSLEDDVRNYVKDGKLKELRGIGESISEKIEEYISTGKIKKHQILKKKVPIEFAELLDVKGFGPQSLVKIKKELGITTKAELNEALKSGKVDEIKGFGPKKVAQMIKGLDMYKSTQERILLWDALEIGENILENLKKIQGVKKISLAGSLRRRKESIGDIDLLIASPGKDNPEIMKAFSEIPGVTEIIAKGDTKASILIEDNNRQVDLRIVKPDEWGAALVYFTGSKEHNIHLRELAKKEDLKLSEYGIFHTESGTKIAMPEEDDVYKKLKMAWIPPELREDTHEIDWAKKNKIPELVDIRDIKGDLQMHSDWSDGINSIEEIAEFLLAKFNYEYIALTDHSKAVRIAKGMDEKKFMEQLKEIKRINKNLGKDFIKAGCEVDILENGTLDLDDEILSEMDWVVASIHSKMGRDNTDRIINACENPYVCAIGHPTGRVIGVREPYHLNFKEVLQTAKETGTALEINAQPDRMDLNENQAFIARENGVKLVISTDSHNLGTFACMQLGVYIARRAWCTAEDILNTNSWDEIATFRDKKRKKILNFV